MRRSQVLVIGVLLAVVAGGAAFWKTHRKAPATAPAAAPVDAGPAKPPPRPHAGDDKPPAELSVRLDDDPKGPLRLEGQVVDADEQPVGGVTVAIDANPPRQLVTEADGSFAFDGLLQRGYEIEAHKDDRHAGPVNVNVVTKTEPVTLRLVAGVSLTLTVLDAEGKKPIAGAHAEALGSAPLEAVTGSDGVAKLRGLGGGWQPVQVSANGFAPSTEPFQLSRTPGAEEHQTMLLHRGVAVSGRVVDDAGKPVAGARVVAQARGAFFGVDRDHHEGVESDAQGHWKLPAVAAGTWRFEASEARHAPGQSAPIAVEAGRSPAEVLITLAPAGSIAGEVHSAAGQPVPYATVRVASAENSGLALERARQAACDEHGRFLIEGLARRKASVLAAHESGSSDVVVLDLAATPEQKNLVLVLSQDGAIAGTVVNATGQPVPEARVYAFPELGGDAEVSRWQLLGKVSDIADQAGAFRLTGLPKGTYQLRVSRTDEGTRDIQAWLRKAVPAETGATGVKLVLEDDATVKGKVAFADGSSPEIFTVSSSMFGTPTPFSSKTGEFHLEGVPPGKRSFSVSGASFARKETPATEVKAGVETDLGTIIVERGRTLHGKVVRADGTPVEGAHVLAGARLFGDGQKLIDSAAMGSFGLKTADSDDTGHFDITGLGVKAMLVIGDEEAAGRSPTVSVPPGTADVDVTLTLAPPGQIDGTVTRGGKPFGGVPILVQAQSAGRAILIAKADSDGTFHVERVGADTYEVSVMQMSGGGGASMQGDTVKVVAGETAHVAIELTVTDLTLTVTPQSSTSDPLQTTALALFADVRHITNYFELEQATAARGAASYDQLNSLNGAAKKFTNVTPGVHTLCAVAFKGNVNPATMTGDAFSDERPVQCQAVEIAKQPNDQSVVIKLPGPKP